MPDNGDELLSGSAVPGAYATRTVNDMRQLKAAMLLYYFYNQDVWPTEADVDKLDQYCDYPIVRVNPPRYAAVMIKNGSIGVRLIPKNGDASVQAVLAKNADEWGLWSNADGGTAYESGSEVWMRVYNIPQAEESLSGSAVAGSYATRTVNDMRQLKAAMLLYYFYNQNVWPTEADIDKVDPYCDYPIVRANPPRYAAVMIKNGSIGVRLIPKNGDASVQAILAQNADKYWLWSNSEGTIAYKSGSEVWMRVYNIPQATDAADASPLLPFEYRDGDDHVSGKDYHYWYHAEDSPYHTMGVHFADHEGKRSKRESDLYAVDLN
jgi:hypothetical protein